MYTMGNDDDHPPTTFCPDEKHEFKQVDILISKNQALQT